MNIPRVKFRQSKLTNDKIEIIDLESLSSKKSDHNPIEPHRVSFYLLIYIESGEGSHFIDFNRYEFKSGSFIFINKNQVHAFDLSRQPKGKMILFTSNFINEVQMNMRIPMFSPTYLSSVYSPIFTTDLGLKQSSEYLIEEIKKEAENHAYNDLVIMCLFSALFMMIEREKNKDELFSHSDNKKFNEFMDLLEQDFTSSRDASAYAEKMHITYKTLNNVCKSTTKQTVKQLIDAYTILESKRRLTIENRPIQQLAFDLGFDEPSNFVKYFKKHTSLTPSQFRKDLQG